ncbi:hypothetical protein RRG08_060954 [Elysia crispata]|uniref:Uncharacterized protein n=1 Tax=Elysia crispata TaxID=231223 RepID=A0AAE1AV50_9GAST|nr:hypothetical protein RRG08_060954 [Elysia crispata]
MCQSNLTVSINVVAPLTQSLASIHQPDLLTSGLSKSQCYSLLPMLLSDRSEVTAGTCRRIGVLPFFIPDTLGYQTPPGLAIATVKQMPGPRSEAPTQKHSHETLEAQCADCRQQNAEQVIPVD